MKILVIHGPNLNLLGEREPGIYGTQTYESLNHAILDQAAALGVHCEIFQSNHEGAIIDKLHAARHSADAIVLNAGAFTHYSYAIRDAIAAVKLPCVEVHISNVHAREEFRHTSVLAPVCMGVICGMGGMGYLLAMQGLTDFLQKSAKLSK